MRWRHLSNHPPPPPPPWSPPPHFATTELKHQILSSLSKLADRDTHQIALQHLENLLITTQSDAVPVLFNCLCDAVSNDPKPSVKRESIRLLAVLCAAQTAAAAAYVSKIVCCIVKRLKDVDSQVRDACRDAIGELAGLYLRGGDDGEVLVLLFVRPLLEVMSENCKTSQGGAALCLAKMVECAAKEVPLAAFRKICVRVVKYLNCPCFVAKAQLLRLVSSLSQVRAITPQSLEPLLQGIHECLGSSDWATRKAAAEALSVISLNKSNITPEQVASTLKLLEARSFDKVRSVRESMTEALQLWKKIAGKGDASIDEHKASSHDSATSEGGMSHKVFPEQGETSTENAVEDTATSFGRKGNNISDKAIKILKKKAPALSDKELNPGFFQKLETRVSGEFPVEVIVPRRRAVLANSKSEEESESNEMVASGKTRLSCQAVGETFKGKYGSMEKGVLGDQSDSNQRESSRKYAEFSRNPGQSEGFMNNNENWSAIQRQLVLLESQQANLMHMLQGFMGGSHDGMMTLENRIRGLERVLEDVTQDLPLSAGRRATNTLVGRKYHSFHDYSRGDLGRVNDGRIHLGKRFAAYDCCAETKGRSPSWRSDASDSRDFHAYGKFGRIGSRRSFGGGSVDLTEADQNGGRRVWGEGARSLSFHEGPSARSVWRGSKDEATLVAIRIAGEDNRDARSSQTGTPDITEQASDTVWTWRTAMDSLRVGDVDFAFAEVLSSGDDVLLVRLMKRSGPVIDRLSYEVAIEVLHAISQFLVEQNLFETSLYWVQQLVDIIMENGPDVIEIPEEVKREILLNLDEACSSMELPENWDGSAPNRLLLQLASVWEIDMQHFGR